MQLRRSLLLMGLGAMCFWSANAQWQEQNIKELLSDNLKLKDAIARLSHEDQIGYAEVIDQGTREGKTYSKVKFVETHRENSKEILLEKTFDFVGDEIHFDALIIKFDNRFVADGKSRSMYLWRRVYSESMAPESGYPIEEKGREPIRYNNFLGQLSPLEKMMLKKDQSHKFWNAIWDLAETEEALEEYGIQAIYGNAVYSKVKPGFRYYFKISNTGQFYINTVKALNLN